MRASIKTVVWVCFFANIANIAFASSTTTVTITGSEQQISGGWDSGVVTVSFEDTAGHWYIENLAYGQYSTPASIASGLAGMFSRDYVSAGLCAHANGSTISFTTKTAASLGQPGVNGSTASFSATATGGYAQGTITTIAGNGTTSYAGDGGSAINAGLYYPGAVVAATNGDVYISDTYHNVVRKVLASTGIITTVAGNGYTTSNNWGGYSGDGGPAVSAELNWPQGLALDTAGNLYIADEGNNRVRKVNAGSGIITTVVGNGSQCIDGVPAAQACLNAPIGVAVDGPGNLYISDTQHETIRKVDVSTGLISTIAGTGASDNGMGAYSGDGGPAISADLNWPMGIAVDQSGNVYFADYGNDRIRKITASTGIITTVAGNGTIGYSGDGSTATSAGLSDPYAVAVDVNGNIYIADTFADRVRKVQAASGIISTVAGIGTYGYSGDGGPAVNAQLGGPDGLALGPNGTLYIADTNNERIRAITPSQTTPPITWYAPGPIIYGTPLSSVQLNASSSVPGTFIYSPATNTTLAVGFHTLTATFIPTDTTDYSVATAMVSLNVSQATPSISWPSPSNITSGTVLSATQLNATSNVAGSFSYSPALGTVLGVGSHSITATFTPTDGSDYSVATATAYITVTQPTAMFDQGSISLMVNNSVVATASYGQGATPSTIASQLAANVASSSPVNVNAVNDVLYLKAKGTGASTNYSYSLQTAGYDAADFSQPSFMSPAANGNLTGGADQNSSTGTIYSYSGGYDGAGNLINYNDSVMGTWSFSYDTLNRLIGSSGSQSNNPSQYYCWSYDSFGNRTQQIGSSLAFVQGTPNCTPSSNASLANSWTNYSTSYNNRLTNTTQAVGGVAYDGAGNVTDDGLHQYLYDAEGRICAVAGNGVTTGYIYNAEGRRVAKGNITSWSCDPGLSGFTATNDYVLGLNGEQVTEMTVGSNNNMVWQHTNVYAAGALIGTYDTDGLHFYLNDPLGTRRVQTNFAGVLEQTCSSLPFGDSLNCTNSIQNPTEHHFTGKERDSESGLDYFGARYYASSMGRMMSPDPHSGTIIHQLNPQRWNMYAYALNNPLSFTDPTGMDAVAVNFSGMVGGLGHEGILSIHSDGSTTYGRFGPAKQDLKGGYGLNEPGQVDVKGPADMPKVEFGSNGLPTAASYAALEKAVAAAEGVNPSTVRLNYFKTSESETAALDEYIKQKQAKPGRYGVCDRNCATFTMGGLMSAGVLQRWQANFISIDPNSMFKDLSGLADDNKRGNEKVTVTIRTTDGQVIQ
jgi:RHS repeat-associated protein